MAQNVILLDTSILIDYYRRIDKRKSVWLSLIRQGYAFAISVVTKYEIHSGATESQLPFPPLVGVCHRPITHPLTGW